MRSDDGGNFREGELGRVRVDSRIKQGDYHGESLQFSGVACFI